MNAQPKYAEVTNKQRSLQPFIPFSSIIRSDTIVLKTGELLRFWKVAGIAFETADADEIALRKDRFNTMLRSIGSSSVALWHTMVRRRISDRLEAAFDNDFCRDLDRKYYESFTERDDGRGYKMMANELYLCAIFRPTVGRFENVLLKGSRRSLAQIQRDRETSLRKLDEISYQIEAGMRAYGIEENGPRAGIQRLTTYRVDGVLYSEQLELLNYLTTGDWQRVRVPHGPLDSYLGNGFVNVGTKTIQIETPLRTRYAQCIDFKDYGSNTEPGMLNGLMYSDFEHIITQSFSFLSKPQGKKFLENQQRQLMNTEDGSLTQIQEMSIAIDELVAGQFVMGEYHYTMMVFGDTVEQVEQNTTAAMSSIQDQGFLAARVTTATDAAFYAQLPGNWHLRPRIATITSKNYAGLACFHNFRAGKRDGNPWGQAVTILKTVSGQPCYFNYHFAKGDEDQFDKKLLGNTRIIGQSGAGKTVLMNFLTAQAQKYAVNAPLGFRHVLLDKDEGGMLTTLAIGGKYLRIKNGEPTGLQPAQLEPTESNTLFLEKLYSWCATRGIGPLTASDEDRLSHAVRTVMRFPKELRSLSTVLQNINEPAEVRERDNSLVKRLARWARDDGQGRRGALWWVVDCERHELDFSTHRNYGIDGTGFLDNKETRTPISMVILHCMEQVIDGCRFIYDMDEAWKWVDDEAFADFVGDKQLTIRKQGGLGVFATQMPSSLLNSKVASQLVQQVATEIYLPNPSADFREYTEGRDGKPGFGLTHAEFLIVKNMPEDSRQFLVKQGHQSMIARLDLAGFDDELAILSGSTDNNELALAVIADVGDNPSVWLPEFHARRKARVASSRKPVRSV